MKIALLSLTEKGRALSKKISNFFSDKYEIKRYCFFRHTDSEAYSYISLPSAMESKFNCFDAIIFICACGIAVRTIAPFVTSKDKDPAVIVIDDSGKFVISLLSGHIGGANRLTEIISESINAIPVITTATDIENKFSPDLFAKANDLIITNMDISKKIASSVLENKKIGVKSDYPYINLPPDLTENSNSKIGIYIGNNDNFIPFNITLRLVPKNVVLGIGCKKGTPINIIEDHVKKVFYDNKISFERICAVATIDIKLHEQGLIDFSKKYDLPIFAYSAEELMSVKGDFAVSAFVKNITGADNICERSAAICSKGKLIINKSVGNGVTAAAAEKKLLLDFERRTL